MLDTTKNGVLSLCGTFLGLTIITVALRFWARYKTRAPILADDWLTVVALIVFIGVAAETIYGVHQGYFGYHEPHNITVVDQDHAQVEKLSVSFDVLVDLAYGCIKLSALFFYRRVFCVRQAEIFSITTWIMIVVVTMWTITFIIFPLRACGPNINTLWRVGASAHCVNAFRYFKGVVISDFLLDVIIIVLPIPRIWSLHTSTKRKFAISTVFLLALAGVGASAARMAITLILVLRGRPVDDEDSYQVNTQWQYYGVLECGLTLVAVNLPSLWCFVANAKPERVLSSIRSMVSLSSGRSVGKNNGSNKATEVGSERSKSMDMASTSPHGGDAVPSLPLEHLGTTKTVPSQMRATEEV